MGIVFVHCPKTAGCSVSRAIGGCHAFVRNPLVRDGHFSVSRYSGDLEGSFVFTVARNPWDRLVSCYHYALRRRESDPNAYWLQKHSCFSDFVYYIRDIDEEFGLGGEKAFKDDPEKLRRSLDRCHLRNIVDCVSLGGAVRSDFVCNFHSLDRDWGVLSGAIGVSSCLDVVNASSSRKDYRMFYDDDLAEIVGRIYCRDIVHFGYSFEDPSAFGRQS